jgi:hypothetical protein
MMLDGSCHCQAVRFRLESTEPVPFMRCYCSICRKTNGAGGYAINLGGDFNTLEVEGEDNISVYVARFPDGEGGFKDSNCERRFCKRCGSGLWVYSPDWPDLVHPFASAIDTELPQAPAHTHMMLTSKSSWVPLEANPGDRQFDRYPDESLADWHRRMGFPAG